MTTSICPVHSSENKPPMVQGLKDLIRAIPGAAPLYSMAKFARSPFFQFVPPGHFYSPIPDLKAVMERESEIFNPQNDASLGIDLRTSEQLELLQQFATFYSDLPFPETPTSACRYHLATEYFPYTDGIVLYSMLRHFQPKQVVEVGSGFSSAAMLDTNDRFLDRKTQFTFIEPYPNRLELLLSDDDQRQHEIIEQFVQDVSFEYFERLEAGDFLFIDSSHVMKIGSDVVHLMFEVLPRLKPGVIIHFHDIFCGFEYPKEWIESGRAWNEAYCLRAFLQFNTAFQILFFNSFMEQVYPNELRHYLPLCKPKTGQSLWLQKVA